MKHHPFITGLVIWCLAFVVFVALISHVHAAGVDLEKLAHAVAVAETSNCTAGVGLHRNNCFGIRRAGKFVTYAKPEDSYADFKDLWLRKYGDRFPTRADARRYTASDGTEWLSIVTKVYNR